jgi:hypothetical protein
MSIALEDQLLLQFLRFLRDDGVFVHVLSGGGGVYAQFVTKEILYCILNEKILTSISNKSSPSGTSPKIDFGNSKKFLRFSETYSLISFSVMIAN